jgi:hypothetical protein
MTTRIQSFIAAGEGDREQSMRIALSHDPRFEPLVIISDIPVDLCFSITTTEWRDSKNGMESVPHTMHRELNIELKRPIDFVQSVLSGHLMDPIYPGKRL